MTQLVLLNAVSGAGKTCGLKCLSNELATVIELDRIIERLYVTLGVGGPIGNDVYHYDNWRPFLESNRENIEVITTFSKSFVDLRGKPNNVVIAGNHFVMPSMTAMIDRSIAPHFEKIHRLFLDVPADIVYAQRQKRGTDWDRKVTAEQVADEIERMRKSVTDQDFVIVTSESMVHKIEGFLGCG